MSGESRQVGTWLGQWVIESNEVPANLPINLGEAVYAFIGESTGLADEALQWAVEKSDGKTARRFAEVVADGSLVTMAYDSVGMDHRWVGQMVVAPALLELGDGAWAVTGDDPPDDWDNPMGSWLYGVTVHDAHRFDRLSAERLPGAVRLAMAIGEGDWTTCDHCEGLYDMNEGVCVRACSGSLEETGE